MSELLREVIRIIARDNVYCVVEMSLTTRPRSQ